MSARIIVPAVAVGIMNRSSSERAVAAAATPPHVESMKERLQRAAEIVRACGAAYENWTTHGVPPERTADQAWNRIRPDRWPQTTTRASVDMPTAIKGVRRGLEIARDAIENWSTRGVAPKNGPWQRAREVFEDWNSNPPNFVQFPLVKPAYESLVETQKTTTPFHDFEKEMIEIDPSLKALLKHVPENAVLYEKQLDGRFRLVYDSDQVGKAGHKERSWSLLVRDADVRVAKEVTGRMDPANKSIEFDDNCIQGSKFGIHASLRKVAVTEKGIKVYGLPSYPPATVSPKTLEDFHWSTNPG